jgi:signal recognition particle GTPase
MKSKRYSTTEDLALSGKNKVRKMAITGLRGAGKTQIALELAYQIRDKKLECSIFWIPSTSVEKIEQAYMGGNKEAGTRT